MVRGGEGVGQGRYGYEGSGGWDVNGVKVTNT